MKGNNWERILRYNERETKRRKIFKLKKMIINWSENWTWVVGEAKEKRIWKNIQIGEDDY